MLEAAGLLFARKYIFVNFCGHGSMLRNYLISRSSRHLYLKATQIPSLQTIEPDIKSTRIAIVKILRKHSSNMKLYNDVLTSTLTILLLRSI